MSEKYPVSDIFNKGALDVLATIKNLSPEEEAEKLLAQESELYNDKMNCTIANLKEKEDNDE